jgi:xylan 1,4-beta-xylosidase
MMRRASVVRSLDPWSAFAFVVLALLGVCVVAAETPAKPETPAKAAAKKERVAVKAKDACLTAAGNGWGRGFDGHRRSDLGNGCYRNPIFAGDHPDPSILKDGSDYYMTFSSFDAYPGLVVWRSRDLVNWQPLGPALTKNVGSVWAPDLVKFGDRYFIYFPARAPKYQSNYVVWADSIVGPWSEPVDLKLPEVIDPGHAVGEDGKRYLFLSGGQRVALSDDGLAAVGEVTKVYDGWRYPDDWPVESFSLEGPKVVKHGDYFHMLWAEGGTAGPATSHMIVSARAKSINGPWQSSPLNPVVHTRSADERWWSRGHGSLVEGPDGRWYVVYHAYEKGFQTLGRQTLLEPVEWTKDGWFKLAGSDPARPILKPAAGARGEHGIALSDDFSTNKLGTQWSFCGAGDNEAKRARFDAGSLVLKASGASPADSSPLCFVAPDHAYMVEVAFEASKKATAGLVLYYNRRLYAGLGFGEKQMVMHRYGQERFAAKPEEIGRQGFLRIINDRNLLSLYYSADGKTWKRRDTRIEVSGYQHNTVGEFLSLRPALYAAGDGEVRFRSFKYEALP